MSETQTFSIRLSREEQRLLNDLCRRYGRSRPDSVRQAMRDVLALEQSLPLICGMFAPVPVGSAPPITIRLREKGRDHG